MHKGMAMKIARTFLPLLLTACGNPSPTTPPAPWGFTPEDVLPVIEAGATSECPDARRVAAEMRQWIRQGHFNSAAGDMPALMGFLKGCEDERRNCGKGAARIGMTKGEVEHTSWCTPDKINKTTIAGHTKEQWVYQSQQRPRVHRGYLYFDNNRLTTIQETEDPHNPVHSVFPNESEMKVCKILGWNC